MTEPTFIHSVPPKLNAFSVDKHLKLGQRVSMLCSATEGDLPMTIRWFRNEVPLGLSIDDSLEIGDPRMSITELGAYESVLRIDNLRPEHNANYSCRAENRAGRTTHSQRLLVKGKFNYKEVLLHCTPTRLLTSQKNQHPFQMCFFVFNEPALKCSFC